MARPSKNALNNGVQGWDGPLDDNIGVLFNGPLPIHEHTGDQTDLESTFAAASYDRCSIMVDHTTKGWVRYVSDGTSWILVELVENPEVVAPLTDNTAGTANDTLQALSAVSGSDLTDNTTGTANDTLEAVPDPSDSPVDADALRDDLVANALPAIRNNYADLAAKVNSLRDDVSSNLLPELRNNLADLAAKVNELQAALKVVNVVADS